MMNQDATGLQVAHKALQMSCIGIVEAVTGKIMAPLWVQLRGSEWFEKTPHTTIVTEHTVRLDRAEIRTVWHLIQTKTDIQCARESNLLHQNANLGCRLAAALG